MKRNTVSLALIITVCISLLLHSCTQVTYYYGAVGTPSISDDGKYVVVLVAESRAISKQVNGGYRSTDYTTNYWLKVYETATGEFVRKKKIIEAAEDKNIQPVFYGAYHDKIWLHTYGLVAYDIKSLEETLNQDKLAAQSRFDKDNFPDDARYISHTVADGYIRFRAIDGEKYRLDLNSLKIQTEKEAPVTADEKRKENLQAQMNMRPTYGKRVDTIDNKMLVLAKDSEEALDIHPGNANEETVYKRLYLFTTNYTVNSIGGHHFYKSTHVTKLAGQSYINGIFLKDFSTDEIVRLQKLSGYIILHNDSLYNEARALLTAVDSNNKELWQLSTGLSTKITGCTSKDNYLILAGNKNYLVGPHIGSDMLCIINTQTGKIKMAAIAE